MIRAGAYPSEAPYFAPPSMCALLRHNAFLRTKHSSLFWPAGSDDDEKKFCQIENWILRWINNLVTRTNKVWFSANLISRTYGKSYFAKILSNFGCHVIWSKTVWPIGIASTIIRPKDIWSTAIWPTQCLIDTTVTLPICWQVYSNTVPTKYYSAKRLSTKRHCAKILMP